MLMTNYKFVSASKCQYAAHRLSGRFNLDGIIDYARHVRNPRDLDLLTQVLSKVGLFLHCNQDDLGLCVQYIDILAGDLYHPHITKQYNRHCQLFYGDIHDSEFHSPINLPFDDLAA